LKTLTVQVERGEADDGTPREEGKTTEEAPTQEVGGASRKCAAKENFYLTTVKITTLRTFYKKTF